MNTILQIVAITIVLLVVTYINTVKSQETFASPKIPEFDFTSFKQHDQACKASMDRCKDPFCMNFSTGSGPLMDCVNEYKGYATKTNGLIPTYQSGDWDAFSF